MSQMSTCPAQVNVSQLETQAALEVRRRRVLVTVLRILVSVVMFGGWELLARLKIIDTFWRLAQTPKAFKSRFAITAKAFPKRFDHAFLSAAFRPVVRLEVWVWRWCNNGFRHLAATWFVSIGQEKPCFR